MLVCDIVSDSCAVQIVICYNSSCNTRHMMDNILSEDSDSADRLIIVKPEKVDS